MTMYTTDLILTRERHTWFFTKESIDRFMMANPPRQSGFVKTGRWAWPSRIQLFVYLRAYLVTKIIEHQARKGRCYICKGGHNKECWDRHVYSFFITNRVMDIKIEDAAKSVLRVLGIPLETYRTYLRPDYPEVELDDETIKSRVHYVVKHNGIPAPFQYLFDEVFDPRRKKIDVY